MTIGITWLIKLPYRGMIQQRSQPIESFHHLHIFQGKVPSKDPTPYVFRGPFELLDPGKNFAGQLDLDITVRNLGRYFFSQRKWMGWMEKWKYSFGRALVTPYVLAPKCFVFKNVAEGPEFRCQVSRMGGGVDGGLTAANVENTVREDLFDRGPAGNMMADVAAISPAAPRLALGSPPPKLPRPPLIDPTLVKKKPKKKKKKK